MKIFYHTKQVASNTEGYGDIPWFDGCRVDTVQRTSGGDTAVCFTDRSGQQHEFEDVEAYLRFYEQKVGKIV